MSFVERMDRVEDGVSASNPNQELEALGKLYAIEALKKPGPAGRRPLMRSQQCSRASGADRPRRLRSTPRPQGRQVDLDTETGGGGGQSRLKAAAISLSLGVELRSHLLAGQFYPTQDIFDIVFVPDRLSHKRSPKLVMQEQMF